MNKNTQNKPVFTIISQSWPAPAGRTFTHALIGPGNKVWHRAMSCRNLEPKAQELQRAYDLGARSKTRTKRTTRTSSPQS